MPSPQVLPPIVLRADLGDRPARWRRVAFIPFGPGEGELGYRTFPDTPASQPSAFAVAPDGSFWIDDRWKRRLVHYSGEGTFLGSVRGLDGPGWDVAVVDGEVHVLVEQMTGTVGTVREDALEHVDLTYGGSPLFTIQIVPTERGLVAEAALVPGGSRGEFGSFLRIDPPDPEAGPLLPGLPLGDGATVVDAVRSDHPAHPGGDQDFDLTFTTPELAQVRPVQFELIGHDGSEARSIPAVVGLTEPLPDGDDVLVYCRVSPTRPGDAERYGDGRWLLRIGRSPLLWERLPSPAMSDELHHRHLAVGPDGGIYLMVTEKDGMLILRRGRPGTG